MSLRPAVGTIITGEGKVVRRDETVAGLHRMCVELKDRYPDLETWADMVSRGRTISLWRHRYTEKVVSNVFTGFLWIYWKEG